MNSYRQHAFLSFLDLISCAFGAAVLIFVISAVGGDKDKGVEAPDVLLVYARHVNGDAPEIQFEIRDPLGVVVRTTDELPIGYRRFAAPANSRSGAYLIVPKPSAGQWSVRAFWVDGRVTQNAVFKIELFCKDLKPKDRIPEEVVLSPRTRYSQEIVLDIRK